MAIWYRKLRKLLKQYQIQMQILKKETGISHTTLAKINKDEYIQLNKLESICEYLEKITNKKIDFCDIMERVDIDKSERIGG